MSNKTINLLANVVVPIVTGVLTIVLFFLFRPEETTALFYLNLVYSLILEGVFFGYIGSLHRDSETVSTPFRAIFGITAAYYIIGGLGWMLLYSLLLRHFASIKVYIAVLAIFTLLWIILSLLMGQTDSNYQVGIRQQEDRNKVINYHSQKMQMLATRYERLCREKGIAHSETANGHTPLDLLSSKISGLTPNVFRNATAVTQLNTIIDRCESLLYEAEDAPDDKLPDIARKMQRLAENSISEIDLLKNLARG